jgi:hypothetical protein
VIERKQVGRPFAKGRSGNPSGRRKSAIGSQALYREYGGKVLAMLVKEMTEGGKDRVRAAELLLAYGYERPVQTMNLRKITSIADLTDEELAVILGEEVRDATNTAHQLNSPRSADDYSSSNPHIAARRRCSPSCRECGGVEMSRMET